MYRRNLVLTLMVVLVLLGLAACGTPSSASTQNQQPAAPAIPAASTPLPPAASTVSAAVATPPGASSPSSAQVAAIQSVIQKANQEQVQAVADNNPALMQDTSTPSYYQQSAQGVNDMLSSGVKSIQLVSLKWGPIALQNPTTAQATTTETWNTTFSDGSTMQETDTNVYTLIFQNGAWKVQNDQHPNTRTLQPPSSGPGGTATQVAPITPAQAGSAQSQSRNWSGYAATGGTFTAVSGTWTVPNVKPGNKSAIDATWVGIGGVTSQDLIQAGTQAVVQNGQVQYSAWWETLPQASQNVPLDVNAGDTVTVSITQQPDGTWLIRISDSTNAQSWQDKLTYQSSRSSAEWVEEAPSVGRRMVLPLDNFGTVTFTKASTVKDGQTITIAQAGAQPITLDSGSGKALAQTSTLAGDGAGFTVARTSVTAPSVSPSGRRFSGGGNQP